MESWERLERVILWSKLSTNAFANKIGLKRSENLYRIMRDKGGISRKLSEKITAAFPEISAAWLISGEGDMMKSSPKDIYAMFERHGKILFNPIYCFRFISSDNQGGFVTFDYPVIYIKMKDESMSPAIPLNACVFCKKQNPDDIVSGRIYYVETETFSGIRILMQDVSDTGKFILEPVNKQKFIYIHIFKSDIINIYIADNFFCQL